MGRSAAYCMGEGETQQEPENMSDSDLIIGGDDAQPGNAVHEAYVPEFIQKKREPLKIVGPFIVASGFNPKTHEVTVPCLIHMDHIHAISAITDTKNDGGVTRHVLYGSVVFQANSQTAIAYSPAEIGDLIESWNVT